VFFPTAHSSKACENSSSDSCSCGSSQPSDRPSLPVHSFSPRNRTLSTRSRKERSSWLMKTIRLFCTSVLRNSTPLLASTRASRSLRDLADGDDSAPARPAAAAAALTAAPQRLSGPAAAEGDGCGPADSACSTRHVRFSWAVDYQSMKAACPGRKSCADRCRAIGDLSTLAEKI
jgi:hypothetical protein